MNAKSKDILILDEVKATARHVSIDPPKPQAGQSEAVSLLSMIERAARDPSVDIEKFERLMAMRERMEERAAKQAFDNAVSLAKGEIGPIRKNKVVDFTSPKGRTNYRHEDFAEVARVVDPVLKQFGLSYRFRSKQDGAKLTLTCILSHRDGYAEETTLEAAKDESGNKNAIQAVGSVATYLQRYTLKLALGLAASEQDDDGRASGKEPEFISEDEVMNIRDILESYGANEAGFCKAMKVERLSDIPATKYQAGIALIHQKKAQR